MSKAERSTLADQLRRAIEESGITLYKLSQDSGVDRSQLSRFMRGERDMSLVVSDKVCELLGLRFCKTEDSPARRPAESMPARLPKSTPATPPAGDLEQEGKKRHAQKTAAENAGAKGAASAKQPRARKRK